MWGDALIPYQVDLATGAPLTPAGDRFAAVRPAIGSVWAWVAPSSGPSGAWRVEAFDGRLGERVYLREVDGPRKLVTPVTDWFERLETGAGGVDRRKRNEMKIAKDLLSPEMWNAAIDAHERLLADATGAMPRTIIGPPAPALVEKLSANGLLGIGANGELQAVPARNAFCSCGATVPANCCWTSGRFYCSCECAMKSSACAMGLPFVAVCEGDTRATIEASYQSAIAKLNGRREPWSGGTVEQPDG